MTTLNDVIRAYRRIADAEQRYREVLRSALADGVSQADISRELNRTRETLRQDAMSDEERARVRAADAERKRQLRQRAGKAARKRQPRRTPPGGRSPLRESDEGSGS